MEEWRVAHALNLFVKNYITAFRDMEDTIKRLARTKAT
jgi:hypothetical protein